MRLFSTYHDSVFPRFLAMTSLGMLVLSGCGSTASVEAAPNAQHPDCADVMLQLPQEIDGFDLRPTDSQATAAWGDPSAVVLRCGVEPTGPTQEPCASVNGVDWVVSEEEEFYRLSSYGREPQVEVLLDEQAISSANVTTALADSVSQIEQERECLAYDQVVEAP